MMKKWGLLAITVLVSLFAIFQNCGEVGGQSPFGQMNLGSQSCEANPQACSSDSKGDITKMKINITTGDSSSGYVISTDATEMTIQGTCDGAGFARTSVKWNIKNNKSGKTAAGLGGSCDANKFSVSIPMSGIAPLLELDTLRIDAKLVGLDNMDNGYESKASDFLNTNVVKLILEPVFDTRANCDNGQTTNFCDKNYWAPVGTDSKYYGSVSTSSNLLNLSPAIKGFCQVKDRLRTNPQSTELVIKFKLTETGLPEPMVTRAQGLEYQSGAPVRCVLLEPTKQKHENLKYNGYFEFPNVQIGQALNWPEVGLAHSSRHVLLSTIMVDTEGTMTRDVISQLMPELHMKFTNPTGGKGWTLPLARKALERFRAAFMFNNNQAMTVNDANDFFIALANGSSFRTYIVDRIMGRMFEGEGPVGVVKMAGRIDQADFPKNIYEIASGPERAQEHMCDSDVGRIPVMPDFVLGGSITNNSNPADPTNTKVKKAVTRLAVCLTYWHYHGALGRNVSFLNLMIKNGLAFAPIAGRPTRCTVPNSNIGDTYGDADGICNAIRYYYDVFVEQYTKTTPGILITGNVNPTQVQPFYEAVSQFYLNHVMSNLACAQGANPLYKNEQQWYLLKSFGVGQRAEFTLIENNLLPGDNGPFAAYTAAQICGSTNARGSIK